VSRGVRAGTDAGQTWAAEGHGRRLIFRTRNRTDPISGFANNGDAPDGAPALWLGVQWLDSAVQLFEVADTKLLGVSPRQLWVQLF